MMFGLDAYPFQLVLGLLNSKVAEFILSFLSPTLDYRLGQIQKIPLLPVKESAMSVSKLVDSSIEYSKNDWDSFETSWDFTHHPLLSHIADDNLSHCRSPVG